MGEEFWSWYRHGEWRERWIQLSKEKAEYYTGQERIKRRQAKWEEIYAEDLHEARVKGMDGGWEKEELAAIMKESKRTRQQGDMRSRAGAGQTAYGAGSLEDCRCTMCVDTSRNSLWQLQIDSSFRKLSQLLSKLSGKSSNTLQRYHAKTWTMPYVPFSIT